MSEHRVGELILDIQAQEGDATHVENAAETFARNVLEACGNLLEDRHPGRLFFLRHLPVRWNVDAADLDNPQVIGELAAELADAVLSRTEFSTSHANEEFAVFEDQADWRASFLAARVKKQAGAWFFETLRSERGTFIQFLERGGMDLILTRLAAQGVLSAVLRTVAHSDLVSLCGALGISDTPKAQNTRTPETLHGLEPGAPAENPHHLYNRLREHIRHLPSDVSREMAAIILFFEMKQRMGSSVSSQQIADSLSGILWEHANAELPFAESQDTAVSFSKIARTSTPPIPAAAHTQYGGLFYLVSLVLELGLAESLWKVCLPEGLVLARILAEVIPPAERSDPAPAIAGGVENPFAEFEVSREQQEAVSTELLTALSAALPRRGLASLPETNLFLDHREEGMILQVASRDSATAIYAYPCEGRDSLMHGVDNFLRIWPRSAGAVRTSPALSELDRQGRLRPSRDFLPGTPVLNFDSHPPPRSALLSQAAGSLLFLFASRAGWSARSIDELISRLRIPARIISPDDKTIEVQFPGDAINIELRRAGLDRNPGWIAWLQKSVQFEFVVGEQSP